jgi:hypothetical protein
MRIGSLSNYRLILQYSSSNPGNSNLKSFGLATKEFSITPPSRSFEIESTIPEKKKIDGIDPLLLKDDRILFEIKQELQKPLVTNYFEAPAETSGKLIDLYT